MSTTEYETTGIVATDCGDLTTTYEPVPDAELDTYSVGDYPEMRAEIADLRVRNRSLERRIERLGRRRAGRERRVYRTVLALYLLGVASMFVTAGTAGNRIAFLVGTAVSATMMGAGIVLAVVVDKTCDRIVARRQARSAETVA